MSVQEQSKVPARRQQAKRTVLSPNTIHVYISICSKLSEAYYKFDFSARESP